MDAYTVVAGDTFETVARKKYGLEIEAPRIARANPGAAEPLVAGTVLRVPALPGAGLGATVAAEASTPAEVSISLNGVRFRFWTAVTLTLSMDSIDSIEFEAPFEPENADFRRIFKPFSYADVTVAVGGAQRFTGVLIGVTPQVRAASSTIRVSAYSLPGVLVDCTPPVSAYPLEYNYARLDVIARDIIAPFGLTAEFDGTTGPAFERVACAVGKKIFAFLTDLAKQRGLIITNTDAGALRFYRADDSGVPVADLAQGASPLVSVAPSFAPQNYYSAVSGLHPVWIGFDDQKYTVRNPHAANVLRPITFAEADTLGADVKTATEARAGRMFANVAAYSARVSTWHDPAGNLWAPGTFVSIKAPQAMIYEPYTFLIRSVVFSRDETKTAAVLNLILPGAFNARVPESLPWES